MVNPFAFCMPRPLNELGTNFQLLGYRYSTQGFYTLDETTYKHMDGYIGDDRSKDDHHDGKPDEPVWSDFYNLYYTKKGKIQANVSQTLGDKNSLFITASEQSYWHTDETDKLLQIGYNGNWHDISYSLTWNYDRSPGEDEADETLAFTVSLPVGQWLAGHDNSDIYHAANTMNASYSMNSDRHGQTSQTTGLNGTLLDDNNLSYNVQESYGNHGVGDSGNTSLNYQGTYGNVKAGYNYSDGYHQTNYGLSGGIVVHGDGVTLSQPLGDTNILVEAPGAAGVALENSTGIKTDWRGYAVIPYATTYRENRVALNTNSLGEDVDIEDAVTNVVPTQGAMVRAKFDAHVGLRSLMTLFHNGKPVPFGATVSLNKSNEESLVGDDGQAYLSGLSPEGQLRVQWGKDADQHCAAPYRLQDTDRHSIIKMNLTCS